MDAAIKKIDAYMQDRSYNPAAIHPFFVSADSSSDYKAILSHFSYLDQFRVSDYFGDDSFPDYDLFLKKLKSRQGQNILLLGLGEAVLLQNNSKLLGEIKDISLGGGKIILLCRGIWHHINALRLIRNRYCHINGTGIDYSITVIKPEFDIYGNAISLKQLVRKLEDGGNGNFAVRTNTQIKAQNIIGTAYQAIKASQSDFPLQESLLSRDLWLEYYKDKNLDGFPFRHWRTFLKLKLTSQGKTVANSYVDRAIVASDNYGEYQEKLLCLLLQIPVADKDFWHLYDDRKKIVKGFSDQKLLPYVQKSAVKDEKRIFYLTDNTKEERHEIIREICRHGLSENIMRHLYKIYPALHKYLGLYEFSCEKGEDFTQYFKQYRECKVQNKISSGFWEMFEKYAKERPYNHLETRNSITEKMNDGNKYLFWLDAMGAEYLPYIQAKAKELGLSMRTQISRAVLPTITSLNKDFFESWTEERKGQSKNLDEIKHKGEMDFNYEMEKMPIYLPEELEIIDKVLDHIKGILDRNEASSAVLTSDHGASRLAVISGNENLHEMQEKGKHSGRCCPISESETSPDNCVAEENGYWVIADYSRFKGSRKASVEAHGGATLEEAVVPIIEFTLKRKNITVQCLNPDGKAYYSYGEFPKLEIYCSFAEKNISLRINGKQYKANHTSKTNIYSVVIDIKVPGKYEAEAYCGDTFAGKISFEIENRGIRKNKDNDDFFD